VSNRVNCTSLLLFFALCLFSNSAGGGVAEQSSSKAFVDCYLAVRAELVEINEAKKDLVASLCASIDPKAREVYQKIPVWHQLVSNSKLLKMKDRAFLREQSLPLEVLFAAQRVAALSIESPKKTYLAELAAQQKQHLDALPPAQLPYQSLLSAVQDRMMQIEGWNFVVVDDFPIYGSHVRDHHRVSLPLLKSNDWDYSFELVHEAVHLNERCDHLRRLSREQLKASDWFELGVLDEARARMIESIVRDSLQSGQWVLANSTELIARYDQETHSLALNLGTRVALEPELTELRRDLFSRSADEILKSFSQSAR
jgi:hypothetical protein